MKCGAVISFGLSTLFLVFFMMLMALWDMFILLADGVDCVEFCLEMLREADVVGLSGEGSDDAVL